MQGTKYQVLEQAQLVFLLEAAGRLGLWGAVMQDTCSLQVRVNQLLFQVLPLLLPQVLAQQSPVVCPVIYSAQLQVSLLAHNLLEHVMGCHPLSF